MKRLMTAFFIVSVYFGSVSGQIINKAITGLNFLSNDFMINAKSDTVWGKLNTPTTLADVMGMNLRGARNKLVEIGNGATMTTEHDTGVVLLTYIKRRTEMRFIFEPDSGTYLFQDIWKLAQVGANQTRLVFERRYVRPIPITSGQISDIGRFLQERLARLKELAEKSK
jgi:hypothetical protein